MPRPRKGVIPPQLRKYLFKRGGGRRGSSMAKRRYSRARKVGRRVYHKARRFFGSRGSSASIMEIVYSFGYGYARGYIVNNSTVQGLLAKLPIGGQYKDNIALGLSAYLVGWFLKPGGMVKELLNTVIRSEAFIAGAKMQGGATMIESSSSYAGVLLN